MRDLPELSAMKSAIRTRVCPICFIRPAGSDDLGDVPRECEAECGIFANLGNLRDIAGRVPQGRLQPYQAAVHELVCARCENLAAGDMCCSDSARQCPMNRHVRDVVKALDAMEVESRQKESRR